MAVIFIYRWISSFRSGYDTDFQIDLLSSNWSFSSESSDYNEESETEERITETTKRKPIAQNAMFIYMLHQARTVLEISITNKVVECSFNDKQDS